MTRNLYVGGIGFDLDHTELSQMFEQYGTVENAKIIIHRQTGCSRGFGFVEMSSKEEAQAAILEMDGQDIDGRELCVMIARPPTKQEQRS